VFAELKRLLRRSVLGGRFQQQILEDHRALGDAGNRHYAVAHAELLAAGFEAPFNSREFQRYSQNGEDGLILHLLARVGVSERYVVEIGTEDGRECNSANLILNFGWRGCLIEAAAHWARGAEEFYAPQRAAGRVRVVHAAATGENVNELLAQAGVPGGAELLSIDIDGQDYWLWQGVEAVQPSVAVIEYNASFGPDRSVTVPRGAVATPGRPFYHGASLAALRKLGERKGYILAGCDSRGVNSFFVRRDLAAAAGIEPVEPAAAFRPHFRRTQRLSQAEQQRALAGLPLVEI
jgi:hypothetical protein